jgi:hypothetical protein
LHPLHRVSDHTTPTVVASLAEHQAIQLPRLPRMSTRHQMPVMLAWLEFQVAGDLVRYRGLTLAYAVLPAFFFVTVALQLATTGFAGALWYWWLNLAVTAVFAVAMFVARRGLAVAGSV